jgi:hypothetical protein
MLRPIVVVHIQHTWRQFNRTLVCAGVNICMYTSVPEIIDPVFAKTSQNARFLLSENERFGLVFVKTGSINSGTGNVTNFIFGFDRV